MDGLAVRIVNGQHSTKVTLVLRRTVSEDVALGCMRTFDGTARAHLKALARGLFGLHLRHFAVSFLIYRNSRRHTFMRVIFSMPAPTSFLFLEFKALRSNSLNSESARLYPE